MRGSAASIGGRTRRLGGPARTGAWGTINCIDVAGPALSGGLTAPLAAVAARRTCASVTGALGQRGAAHLTRSTPACVRPRCWTVLVRTVRLRLGSATVGGRRRGLTTTVRLGTTYALTRTGGPARVRGRRASSHSGVGGTRGAPGVASSTAVATRTQPCTPAPEEPSAPTDGDGPRAGLWLATPTLNGEGRAPVGRSCT